MSWAQMGAMAVLSCVSAVIGAFIGSYRVAFRLGEWKARVEAELREHDERLERGDPKVDQVPVLVERVNAVLQSVDEFKRLVREERATLVTRGECDRRHERDG